MKIKTLWIVRDWKWAETPELLVAWDEFCIDENPDGWREECEKALASVGEIAEHRYLDIEVPDGSVLAAFHAPTIAASVSRPGGDAE